MISDIFQMIAAGQKLRCSIPFGNIPTSQPNKIRKESLLYYSHCTTAKDDIVQAYMTLGIPLNLFEAAAVGDENRVKELVEQDLKSVSSYSSDGWTPYI